MPTDLLHTVLNWLGSLPLGVLVTPFVLLSMIDLVRGQYGNPGSDTMEEEFRHFGNWMALGIVSAVVYAVFLTFFGLVPPSRYWETIRLPILAYGAFLIYVQLDRIQRRSDLI